MRWNERAALACYLIVVVILLGHAAVYLTRSEFMPYHAKAAGVAWNDLSLEMRALLLALIRAIGGGSLAVGAAMAAMLWFAFRRGERWAYWAIPLVAAIHMGVLWWVSFSLAQTTPGDPPWPKAAGVLGLIAVGAVLSAKRWKRAARP